jgi:hypothetical protein
MKIRTAYIYPPIPIRSNDWCATYEGDEPNDAGSMDQGYGATENEAIRDLIANTYERLVKNALDCFAVYSVSMFDKPLLEKVEQFNDLKDAMELLRAADTKDALPDERLIIREKLVRRA